MKVRNLLLSLGLIAMVAAGPAAGKSLKLDPKRTVKIIGGIGEGIMLSAQRLAKLSSESKDPIYLLINSPGGSVMPGMIFVDAMHSAQARGIKIKCVSPVMAASMAFIIMSECDERYALPNSRLLFHPMSLSVSGARVSELLPNLVTVNRLEERIRADLRDILDFDQSYFDQHYYAETFWPALELSEESPRYLEIISVVEGAGEDLLKYRNQSFFLSKDSKAKSVVDSVLRRFDGKGLGTK